MNPQARRRWGIALGGGGAAFFLASALYIVGRDGLRLHQWLAMFGLESGPGPIFELPVAVACVLPDALWQFSFCIVVFALWRGHTRSLAAVACMATPVVLGLGTELCQGIGVLEGVFDPLDLAAMAAASVLAWWATTPLVHRWPQSDQVEAPSG